MALSPIVLLAPLVIRLVMIGVDPDPYYHMGDSLEYLTADGPATERPFGYSLFLHTCLAVLDRSLLGVVIVQSLLGFLTALFYHRVATRYLGLRGRLAAGLYLFVSLWPLNLLYEHTIMAESLFSFLLAAVILRTYKTAHEGHKPFALGALAGCLALVRGVGLLLLPVLIGAVLVGLRGQPLRLRARRAVCVLLGSCALLVPYASLNLQSSGFFGTVAFRGRTMFPYVSELVDPAKVKDPAVREVLAAELDAIRWMPNNELRWSWAVLPQIQRRIEHRRDLELQAFPWPRSPVLQGAVRRYWPHAKSHKALLALLDKALAQTATQAILGDVVGYAKIVGRQLAHLTLDVGTSSATHRLFQSRDTVDRDRHPWDREWFDSLKERLWLESGHDVPDASSAALHTLCARLFDSRLAFFAFSLLAAAALLWRRQFSRGHLVLVAVLLVVTFTPILLQEYYGRYFVPAVNPFLVLIAAGVAAMPRRAIGGVIALALCAQMALSWSRLPDTFPRAWDFSRAGAWGGATFHRNRDGEVSVRPGTDDPGGLVQIMGTTTPNSGVWTLVYSDPDGDGTPPDSAKERFSGHDLSTGLTALVMHLRGTVDPTRVRVFLRDRAGLDTTGGADAPVLASYLEESLRADTWSRVAIPLADFPRYEDEHRPVVIPLPRDHGYAAIPSDGREVGVVDLSRIAALGVLIEGAETGGREPFLLQVNELRFTGDRTVRWCDRDDTRP
jgi:hypothetical protein